MKKFFLFFLLFLLAFLFPGFAEAKIGVGVGTGKIVVEDKLKPGIIYELPSLTVFNTGDELSDYEVSIEYHEKQPELKPAKEWFSFSPGKFPLEPGKAQEVKIKLNLPIRAQPGEYFAYLEGHPVKKAKEGQTTVGVAAAAKLYFTVLPANPVLGVYYRALSFWKVYSPWPQRGAYLFLFLVATIIFRKYFHLKIGLKKPEAKKEDE